MRTSLALICLAGGPALADDATPPATSEASAGDGFMFGPLVAPMGALDIHGGVPIFLESGSGGAMGSPAVNQEFLSVGADFGVIPKLEIGGDFSINFHPNDSHNTFAELHAAYEILPASSALSLGVVGALGINNDRGSNGMGGTSSTTDFTLEAGAWLRYAITRQIAIFTGRAPGPYAIAGFSSLVLPPIRQQLNIGLTSNSPITLDLPVAVWFQATPQLAIGLSTDLARFGIANSNNDIIFKDGIPVALGVNFLAIDQVDLGIDFIDDLKNAGDFYAFVLKAQYRLGH